MSTSTEKMATAEQLDRIHELGFAAKNPTDDAANLTFAQAIIVIRRLERHERLGRSGRVAIPRRSK